MSTDGSDVARKGVEHGVTLAKALNAKLTIITVTEALPVDYGSGHASGWIPTQDEIDSFDHGLSWASRPQEAVPRQPDIRGPGGRKRAGVGSTEAGISAGTYPAPFGSSAELPHKKGRVFSPSTAHTKRQLTAL